MELKPKATPKQKEHEKRQSPAPDTTRREPTPREIREWNENSDLYENEKRL